MYFILSKVLLFLLSPYLWVWALVILAFLTKSIKRKKRLIIVAVVLLYLFSCPLLFNLYINAWNVKNKLPADHKTYSCAIVLGGFSSEDSAHNGYFNASAARFIEGIKLLSTGKVSHIMITGGNGNLIPGSFSEGAWVKTQLKALKYPDSSILIENKSRNTIENAVFSKPILKEARLKPSYILITSDFHMRRARMIFKHEGYDIIADPVTFIGDGGVSLTGLIPDAGTFDGWNIYLKETVGYIINYYKTKP